MRNLPYITVRDILSDLDQEGMRKEFRMKISRPTFYDLEKKEVFPQFERTDGGWRKFNQKQADYVKYCIWKYYRGIDEAVSFAQESGLILDGTNPPTSSVSHQEQ